MGISRSFQHHKIPDPRRHHRSSDRPQTNAQSLLLFVISSDLILRLSLYLQAQAPASQNLPPLHGSPDLGRPLSYPSLPRSRFLDAAACAIDLCQRSAAALRLEMSILVSQVSPEPALARTMEEREERQSCSYH
jgi:hypothetical protein